TDLIRGAGRGPIVLQEPEFARFRDRAPWERLESGSRPAPGCMICSEAAMKPNWITTSSAGEALGWRFHPGRPGRQLPRRPGSEAWAETHGGRSRAPVRS